VGFLNNNLSKKSPHLLKGVWTMVITETERIFNRQFERMKAELLDIKMPAGYLTIISKYWDFAKQDIERNMENGKHEQINK